MVPRIFRVAPWRRGVLLGCWSAGVLGCWGAGVLGCWGAGAPGVLGCSRAPLVATICDTMCLKRDASPLIEALGGCGAP
eukprot:282333-Pelagomonas_calceolata.AAC.1